MSTKKRKKRRKHWEVRVTTPPRGCFYLFKGAKKLSFWGAFWVGSLQIAEIGKYSQLSRLELAPHWFIITPKLIREPGRHLNRLPIDFELDALIVSFGLWNLKVGIIECNYEWTPSKIYTKNHNDRHPIVVINSKYKYHVTQRPTRCSYL